jgi:Protein of unknown function (DUF3185)
MSGLGILGIISLILGVFLIGFALRSAQTFTDKVVQGVTGRYTQKTMFSLIGGALLALLGLVLLFVFPV